MVGETTEGVYVKEFETSNVVMGDNSYLPGLIVNLSSCVKSIN